MGAPAAVLADADVNATIRDTLIATLNQVPGLTVNTAASRHLVWVSWTGSLDEGYWVGAGAVVVPGIPERPTGTGYVSVAYLKDTEDERVSRVLLDWLHHPAAMVDNGRDLAYLAVGALLADRPRP